LLKLSAFFCAFVWNKAYKTAKSLNLNAFFHAISWILADKMQFLLILSAFSMIILEKWADKNTTMIKIRRFYRFNIASGSLTHFRKSMLPHISSNYTRYPKKRK